MTREERERRRSQEQAARQLDAYINPVVDPRHAGANSAEYGSQFAALGMSSSQLTEQQYQEQHGGCRPPPQPEPAFPERSTSAALGTGTVLGGDASMYVASLGMAIQRGFRRKMLAILLLQLCLMLIVSYTFRHVIPCDKFICVIFPAQSMQTLLLGMLCVVTLPLQSSLRDRYPLNMVAFSCWSIIWALFLATAQIPGAIVRSNALYVIFGSCAVGVAFLLFFSTIFSYTDKLVDGGDGQRHLISLKTAGWIAWPCMLTCSIIFCAYTPQYYVQTGHYVGALMVSSLVFLWVCYDAQLLCERLQPDDYMKGVLYFYTDFLAVCCCCLLAGCVSSASS